MTTSLDPPSSRTETPLPRPLPQLEPIRRDGNRSRPVTRPVGRRGWLVRRMLLAADVVGLVLALVLTTLLQQDRLWSAAFATRVGALLVVLPLFVVGGKIYGLYDRDDEHADHSTVD